MSWVRSPYWPAQLFTYKADHSVYLRGILSMLRWTWLDARAFTASFQQGLTVVRRSLEHFWYKSLRWRQGSNLCGQSPMDFKSIALTTRPRQPLTSYWDKFRYNPGNNCSGDIYYYWQTQWIVSYFTQFLVIGTYFETHGRRTNVTCVLNLSKYAYKNESWRHVRLAFAHIVLLATKGKRNPVASMGIEPTTFALLARRSNQLS